MLIIENGTGVVGANSYATVAQLEAYASLRGLSLPATVEEKERLLIRAMDYIETKAPAFAGTRYSVEQGLQWPRYGVWLDGYELLYNVIPSLLIEAQCDIAANSAGIDLLPVQKPSAKGAVTQVTVGPISTSYATPDDGSRALPFFPKADALLKRLYRSGGGMIPVRKA